MTFPAILRRPYPADFTPSCFLRDGLISGLFVYLFMNLFEPFGLSQLPLTPRKILYAGYGSITFLAIGLNNWLLPRLLPKTFREETWNIGKNILAMTWVTLTIGIGCFYFTRLVYHFYNLPLRWVQFPAIVLATFIIGLFPITLITLLTYLRQLQRNDRLSAEANRRLDQHPQRTTGDGHQVRLVAENNRDSFQTGLDDLLYIGAEENYVQIYFLKEKLNRVLLRSSLARVQRQLRPFHPRLFRCHRAYIVNTARILRVTGNAQGLKLTLRGAGETVPVARRYVDEFRHLVMPDL